MTRQARSRSLGVCGFLLCVVLSEAAAAGDSGECVIMLHGLARSASSMEKLADAFEREGYTVANVDYPSRQYPVQVLAPLAIHSGLEQCADARTVHVVTHSLGGILIRYYLQENALDKLGRVVMLAPPNNGSEVVDDYRGVPGFKALNGPAGQQLGTDDESLVSSLEPVSFELGVIAGTKTFNPILSQSLPNPDDGKVSVASARVEGMADFITVERSHPFIMRAPEVFEQTLAFIRTGAFVRPTDEPSTPGNL